MIELPTATAVHRRMPKEVFYKHLSLTASLKRQFVSGVERIAVENSLTKDTLNLTIDSEIKEILFLSVALRTQKFDTKIIVAIAKQNPHKLVFHLIFDGNSQIAIFHGKLYRTEWMPTEEVAMTANGDSLTEIWEGLIEQIALREECVKASAELSIDERLALQEQIEKLKKLIAKTEAAAWKEQQPKKKFALYSKIQEYKKELEELKDG